MFPPYGIVLPNALAPMVEVPLNYDGPFTATTTKSTSGGGIQAGDKLAEQSGSETPRGASASTWHDRSHAWLHPHVDVSHRMHLPSFSTSKQAHCGHARHLPHFSIPAFPWIHPPAHGSATYATSLTAWVPAADIRETEEAYVIEIEVPGLHEGDENQVLVQWMSPRTIVISADVKHAKLPTLMTIPALAQKQEDKSGHSIDATKISNLNNTDTAPLTRTKSPNDGVEHPERAETPAPEPSFLIRERHVGYWRRSFTLPRDAKFSIDPNVSGSGESPSYNIEAGVLAITVPRTRQE
jgi:HSP20 family molecular chaperone IbpA